MRTLKILRSAAQYTALITAIVALGLMATGCGSEEPAPTPAPAPVEKAAEKVVETPVEAKEAPAEAVPAQLPAKAAAPADGKPATLEALAFMPESAQIAYAIPPVNGVLEKLIPFAKRVAPEGIDIDEEVADIVGDLAEDIGVDDAESLNDIALAKGLSLDIPIAVFVDFTASTQSILETLKEAKETEAADEDADADADAAEEADAEEADVAVELPEIDIDDLETPTWAAVLGLSDAKKAEATLMEVVADIPELSGNKKDPVDVDGVSINVYGDYAYFMTSRFAVLGSLAMVQDAAKRVATPASFRYGTDECPVVAADEMVTLIYYDRLMPLLEEVLPALDMIEDLPAPLIEMQVNMMKTALKSEGEDDPAVMTLSWTDEALELKFRMDTETHPGMLEYSGKGTPFKLSQTMPESTLALISLCLNAEMKKQITENYLAAIPEEMTQDAGFAQGMTIANQALELLGEEVSIGIASSEEGLPGLFLMLQLADPEATKGMLQMLVPTEEEAETHNEVEIRTIAAPIPLPLHMALLNDVAFISTDLERMKGIIDLMKAGETSTFFASQNPPLATDIPRYNTILLNTRLVNDVVLPLSMMLGGGIPEDAQPIVEQVAEVVREMRCTQSQQGSWIDSTLSVYINPAS